MQQAVDRTKIVDIEIAGVRGRIPRPSLHGALVVKAAAYGVTADPFRNRHIPDLAVLAAMMRRADDLAAPLTPRDRDHLQVGLAGLKTHRGLWVGSDSRSKRTGASGKFTGPFRGSRPFKQACRYQCPGRAI